MHLSTTSLLTNQAMQTCTYLPINQGTASLNKHTPTPPYQHILTSRYYQPTNQHVDIPRYHQSNAYLSTNQPCINKATQTHTSTIYQPTVYPSINQPTIRQPCDVNMHLSTNQSTHGISLPTQICTSLPSAKQCTHAHSYNPPTNQHRQASRYHLSTS